MSLISPNDNEAFAIYFNAKSGKGESEKIALKFQELLKLQHKNCVLFSQTEEKIKGFKAVVLIGGDGTLNYFINHLSDIKIPILVIPFGTGNDWAKHLNENIPLCDYVDILLNNKTIICDAFYCNDKIVINGMGIGFDAEAAKAVQRMRHLPGWMSYLLGIFRNIIQYKSKNIEVIADSKYYYKGKSFMVNIGNAPTLGGGYVTSPGAKINDGLLNIAIIKSLPVWKRFLYLPKMSDGSHVNVKEVDYFLDSTLEIKTEGNLHAQLDGEIYSAINYKIKIIHKSYLFLIK